MKDTKYNGWTNWETWNFKLWMDNTQHTSYIMKELAKGSDDAYELSHRLSDYVYSDLDNSLLGEGFFSDVCNMAIKKVNFFKIAERLILERENDS